MTRMTLSLFTHLYAVSYQKLATDVIIFDAKDTREDIFKGLVNIVDGRIWFEYFTYIYSCFNYLCFMCEVPDIAVHSWSVSQQRIYGKPSHNKNVLITEGYKNIMDKSNNAVLWKKQCHITQWMQILVKHVISWTAVYEDTLLLVIPYTIHLNNWPLYRRLQHTVLEAIGSTYVNYL